MSIFSHNIYENIRTRTIVLYRGAILLHPPYEDKEDPDVSEIWSLPGGGLEPNESLADCARREVLEETGIPVRVGKIAFLHEWVIPRYTHSPEQGDGHGYGLEVFHYAYPEEPVPDPKPEHPHIPVARWIPLADVPNLPIWPNQLKALCRLLSQGHPPPGAPAFIGHLESPWTLPDPNIQF